MTLTNKATSSEIRKLLTRIENALGAEDARFVAELLDDSLESPDLRVLRMMEQVTHALAQANLRSEQISTIIDRTLSIIEADTAARNRETQAQEERNSISRDQAAKDHEIRTIRWRDVIVPSVTAFASALTTAAAAWFTFGE